MADVLTQALDGANKTRLIYRCNLNFAQFNRYLQELSDSGLIECTGTTIKGNKPSKTYKTTPKGRKLLRVLLKADEFLSA